MVLGADGPALGDLPVACLEPLRGDAHDRRAPVEVAVHDLHGAARGGRGRLDFRNFALDREGVVLGVRELAALAGADPAVVVLPDPTMIRLEPRLWICSATRARAPAPTAMAMTAPTPMMMPSIVSVVRSVLTRRARRALRVFSRIMGLIE